MDRAAGNSGGLECPGHCGPMKTFLLNGVENDCPLFLEGSISLNSNFREKLIELSISFLEEGRNFYFSLFLASLFIRSCFL